MIILDNTQPLYEPYHCFCISAIPKSSFLNDVLFNLINLIQMHPSITYLLLLHLTITIVTYPETINYVNNYDANRTVSVHINNMSC